MFSKAVRAGGLEIVFSDQQGLIVSPLDNDEIASISSDELGDILKRASVEFGVWCDYELLLYHYGKVNSFKHFDIETLTKDLERFRAVQAFYTSEQSLFSDVDVMLAKISPIIDHISVSLQDKISKRNTSTTRTAQIGYVYLVKATTPNTYYKIGLSKDPVERIASMGVKLPFPIGPIHQFPTNDMVAAENRLHQKYADKRVNGEWFELTDADVVDICAIERMEV